MDRDSSLSASAEYKGTQKRVQKFSWKKVASLSSTLMPVQLGLAWTKQIQNASPCTQGW